MNDLKAILEEYLENAHTLYEQAVKAKDRMEQRHALDMIRFYDYRLHQEGEE